MQIHVVQRGEALWMIARRYGVSIDLIAGANQLPDPNRLAVGQTLVIPSPEVVHIVRSGDTLWRIAQQYGSTVQEIVRANRLANPNLLMVGQRLVIPVPYMLYTIQPGETLWRIAQQYGISVEEIIRDNQITNPSLIYPGQIIRIRKIIIEANGYLTRTGPDGQEVARNVGGYLTYLSVFSYHILTDGSLTSVDDAEVLRIAKSEYTAPLMTITNFSGSKFSSDLAHTVLSSSELRERLITNVLNVMRSKGYFGLNIDFEYVYPDDRDNYNTFLALAVERLHAEGYIVSTALAPKVSAGQIGLLYEAHDYPAHGALADFVVLMTYEWGYAAGPPWAIAPVNEVRRVLDYAVTAITPRKILMGTPTYGRDWKLPFVQGTTIAATISPQEAIRRALQYNADIQFNTLYQAPYYYYYDGQGARHVVWFEDARSVQARLNLVKEYGLRGVSYWEMSSPFPQNWILLEENFEVRKLL